MYLSFMILSIGKVVVQNSESSKKKKKKRSREKDVWFQRFWSGWLGRDALRMNKVLA